LKVSKASIKAFFLRLPQSGGSIYMSPADCHSVTLCGADMGMDLVIDVESIRAGLVGSVLGYYLRRSRAVPEGFYVLTSSELSQDLLAASPKVPIGFFCSRCSLRSWSPRKVHSGEECDNHLVATVVRA
jgi:hypothetical protein